MVSWHPVWASACSECASKGHPRMASRDLHEKCFEADTAYEPSKVT